MRSILKILKSFVVLIGGFVAALKILENFMVEKTTDKVRYGVRIVPNENNESSNGSVLRSDTQEPAARWPWAQLWFARTPTLPELGSQPG